MAEVPPSVNSKPSLPALTTLEQHLPFKIIGGPTKLPSQGKSSDAYEFISENGKKYIYKEMKTDFSTRWDHYPGSTLPEKAHFLNDYHKYASELIGGDMVVSTYYIIVENAKGEKCLMEVQEKVEGVHPYQLGPDDPRITKVDEQFEKIKRALTSRRVGSPNHPDLPEIVKVFQAKYPNTELMLLDALSGNNLLVDSEGNLKIIDI